MRKRSIILTILFFFFIFLSFRLGYFLGKEKNKCLLFNLWDMSLLQEAYFKLKDSFINESNLNNQQMLYGAISGMVSSLHDPYTQFFDPEKSQTFLQDTQGEFGGVGIEVGVKKGLITIIAPLENTPAQRIGLKPGDIILKVNGKFVSDLMLDEVINLIRGPEGTSVTLTIFREGWDEPRDFTIVREKIIVPTISFKILKSPKDESIFYLRILQFNENTVSRFKELVPQILKMKEKKIILDLRSNPGGFLESAKEIAGYFLKKNDIILIEEQRNKKQIIHRTNKQGILSDYKIIVLVDEGTASAAEILAASLRDNRGDLLLGQKTFGKGSVQTIIFLSDGSMLKVTFAHWLTPKGEQISDNGLKPDIEVKNENEKDIQLEEALNRI